VVSNELGNLTVRQLAGLTSLNAPAALAAKRLLIVDYEEFIEVLHKDLDECLKYVIETRHLRKNDTEDRTTADIIGYLRSRTYDAKHDEQRGGHCDIVVSHPLGYTWMAECKIHGAYDYLKDGFDQLCSRYMSGIVGEDHGSLIIFVRNVDCAAVVTEWRTRAASEGYDSFVSSDCPVWASHGFLSTHKGTGSGRELKIRHTALALHFDPVV
jgi:hypothetical protein